MAQRNAVLSAYVRIVAGVNDQLRVRHASTDKTATLDAGLYWFGANGADSPPNDATLYTSATSLLEHITTKLALVTVQVQHADSPSITQGRTGRVLWTFPDAGDGIYWGDALTTIAPEWFGVGRASGTYPTRTVAAGGVPEDLSDFSSACVYVVSTQGGVGQHALREDTMSVRRRVRSAETDDGTVSSVYFGRSQGARRLVVPLSGLPREDGPDTTYHAARRFHGHLVETGQSFLYFPDLGQGASVAAWDPDDTGGEGYQYGHQRLKLRADAAVDWAPPREFAGYEQFWTTAWEVTPVP